MSEPEFRPGGDRGLYVLLGREGLDSATSARVLDLFRRLEADPPPGVTDANPGLWNLFLEFDSSAITRRALEAAVRERLAGPPAPGLEGRTVRLPVRYGGQDGPDLEAVAGLTNFTPDEFARRHAAATYTVMALGFTPGFPYMGVLEPALRVPRLGTPRRRVPAGSVGVAGPQTGVYPMESPGGWRLIGRVREPLYDPARREPFLLRAGDRVRFEPSAGPPPPSPEPVALPELGGIAALEVLEPGLLDTLQDAGRRWVGRFGLARAGALDPRAHRLANAIVGNAPGAAALEVSLRGPVFEARRAAVLAAAGGGPPPELNGRPLPMLEGFLVRRGDRLRFPGGGPGARTYLAVAGGFLGRPAYGSVSTDLRAGLGGLGGRALSAGDRLAVPETVPITRPAYRLTAALEPAYGREVVLRLALGPQAHLFPPEAWRRLARSAYRVAAADRMGVRLAGPHLPAERYEIVSEPVPVGALQVPPSGGPVLLLADRGTLGGYAKPAVVLSNDLWRAGQLREGDVVRFRPVALEP